MHLMKKKQKQPAYLEEKTKQTRKVLLFSSRGIDVPEMSYNMGKNAF